MRGGSHLNFNLFSSVHITYLKCLTIINESGGTFPQDGKFKATFMWSGKGEELERKKNSFYSFLQTKGHRKHTNRL